MNSDKKFKYGIAGISLAIFLALVTLSLIDKCSGLEKKLKTLNDIQNSISNQYSEVINMQRNMDSSLVLMQKQKHINSIDAKLLGLDKIETELGKLKKITNRISVQTAYLIKDKEKPFEPGQVEKFDSSSYLRLPYTVEFGDSLYFLKFSQTLAGSRIDSLRIWDKSQIILANRKRGFFKRSEPVLYFENQNRYISSVNTQNLTIKYKPPFYERRWFNFALGGVSGILLYRTLKP